MQGAARLEVVRVERLRDGLGGDLVRVGVRVRVRLRVRTRVGIRVRVRG